MNTAIKSKFCGFTLVELLVALTILSLVVGVAFSSIRVGVTAADKIDWQMSRTQRVHLVQRMLRRQLQQALPVLRAGGSTNRGLDFTASKDHVEFVAPMMVGTGLGGLYRISVSISDDLNQFVGAKKLVLRFRLLTPDDDARFSGYEIREYTILDQFVDAEFTFLDAAEHDALSWQQQWEDERSMPSLIRLRVWHAIGDNSTWPDLIVAPKMTSALTSDDS